MVEQGINAMVRLTHVHHHQEAQKEMSPIVI